MTYKNIHAKPQNLTTNDLDNQDTTVLVKMGRRSRMTQHGLINNIWFANRVVSLAIIRMLNNANN